MKILIADDDPQLLRLLEMTLEAWGYEVAAASDGAEAWEALQAADAPPLAVLDWVMPAVDGVTLCRRIRAAPCLRHMYLILLTARRNREDIIEALEAGADDHVGKPFDRAELRARVDVGARVMRLQSDLAARVRELEEALSRVRELQGLLPICSYCKRVRDDQNYWHQVEAYIHARLDTRFSHNICPECYESVVKPQLAEARAAQRG
ncbi:MAG: response regulator [Armatimonadetes bacterium]|nr:response regulator [Armatimonadota bacterium]